MMGVVTMIVRILTLVNTLRPTVVDKASIVCIVFCTAAQPCHITQFWYVCQIKDKTHLTISYFLLIINCKLNR